MGINSYQLSSKVDVAMQGVIMMQHSKGERENKATTKSEGGFKKGIMDHKVIQNLKPLTGDKSKFRQWHHTLMNAMCQVKKIEKWSRPWKKWTRGRSPCK